MKKINIKHSSLNIFCITLAYKSGTFFITAPLELKLDKKEKINAFRNNVSRHDDFALKTEVTLIVNHFRRQYFNANLRRLG